jgi:hypothetical protein
MSPIPESKKLHDYLSNAEQEAMERMVQGRELIQPIDRKIVFSICPPVVVKEGISVTCHHGDSFPDFNEIVFMSGLGSTVIQKMYYQFGIKIGFDRQEMAAKVVLLPQRRWSREKTMEIFIGENKYAEPCQLRSVIRGEQQEDYPCYTLLQQEILGAAMILPPDLFGKAAKNGLLVGKSSWRRREIKALALPGEIFSKRMGLEPPVAEEKIVKGNLYVVDPRNLGEPPEVSPIHPVGVLQNQLFR